MSLLDRLGIKKVLIVTDFEPDDMIAIYMLLPELRKRNIIPDIVVSCWTDVNIKAQFVRQCFKDAKIFLGLPTSKVYDISSMVQKPSDEVFENWDVLDWTSYSLIIQLSPINELMTLFYQGINFNNTKLAIYASFNIRSVLKKYNTSQVLTMLNSFQQVIYYESFLATSPTMVEDMNVLEPILKHTTIANYIKLWNDLIFAEMKDKDSDVCKRIVASITNCPHQFVHADTGLICTLIMNNISNSLMTGTLSYAPHTNYSMFDDLTPSNLTEKMIVVHNPSIQKELFDLHMDYMRRLF